MRDTLGEYGRVLIVVAMFGLLMWVIFGSSWLSGLGETATPNDVKHDILAELDERNQPIIIVNIPEIKIGDSINFRDYITATDYDGNDISSDIVIDFKDIDYVDGVFTPTYAGRFIIKISVSDSYNFTAYRTYTFEVPEIT